MGRRSMGTDSKLAKAAEAMGVAVGKALNALESSVVRKHRAKGYDKRRPGRAAPATTDDSPRRRTRKTSMARARGARKTTRKHRHG